MELVVEGVAGAAAAGPGRVAELDHEVVDDPVEEHVVVERVDALLAALRVLPRAGPRPDLRPLVVVRPLGEADEVLDGGRGALVEEIDRHVALGGVQRRAEVAHGQREGRTV
mgnify:CR=1 FL=1